MPEPETTTDAGTVTEETATDTTEEAPITETPADDSADGEDGESEGDGEGQAASGKTNVPYDRFKSVNERRKSAELEVAALKAKLEALTPKEPVRPEDPRAKLKKIVAAPADFSPLEQFEYYGQQTLEKHLPEMLERLIGMKPEAAAAVLGFSKDSSRETIKGQFEKACTDRGLNAKDANLQAIVGSAMDTGKFKTFGDAMDVFVKPKTNGTGPKKVVGKGAESEGVDVGGLSRVRALPKNAKEAGVLAAQGKSVEHVSVTDILKGM